MAPLVVIVGETASGKSALALELAKYLNEAAVSRFESVSARNREVQASRTSGTVKREVQGSKPETAKKPAEFLDLPESRLAGLGGAEIICADSWTVYKGFDIGTAKPTREEQNLVPHHLLDVADPKTGFSAAVFQRLAKKTIADIHKRGKLPILVGGTGLYIDSILYDYSFLPPSDPAIRTKLNSMSLDELVKHASKQGLDTDGIDTRNKRRVIRLIENDGVRPTKKPLRPQTLVIGVKRPLDELRERIVRRIDTMVEQGFVDVVKHLMDVYGRDVEAMRAPGYRAFADHVEGTISLETAKERFRQNDLQLAKKQRTWFKRNSSIQWVDNQIQAVELVTTLLNKKP